MKYRYSSIQAINGTIATTLRNYPLNENRFSLESGDFLDSRLPGFRSLANITNHQKKICFEVKDPEKGLRMSGNQSVLYVW